MLAKLFVLVKALFNGGSPLVTQVQTIANELAIPDKPKEEPKTEAEAAPVEPKPKRTRKPKDPNKAPAKKTTKPKA